MAGYVPMNIYMRAFMFQKLELPFFKFLCFVNRESQQVPFAKSNEGFHQSY